MNILITGANGFIGNHLVSTLLKQGHQVVAATHKNTLSLRGHAGLKTIECNFNQCNSPEMWMDKLHNIDIVINAVGIINETASQKYKTLHKDTPKALFKACELSGVKKVIQISALGVEDGADTPFLRSKKNADDYLCTLNLDWVIIMPSIVYGQESKSMNLFKTIAALPLTPLIASGNQKIQPIHINDLCAAVKIIIETEKIKHIKIAFVGSEAITMKNVFIILKQWLNISSNRFIEIPYSVIILMGKISSFIPFSIISSDTIKMLEYENVSDVRPFIRYFGFKPINLSEALEQYPSHPADRCYVKFLWLQPLLGISIAFVWIFTGITSVFLYPTELSYILLQQLGIKGQLAPLVLYSSAALDFLLGLATLFNFHLKLTGTIQILIILFYTILISIFIPSQWLHPFGAISKNLPLIIATAILLILHDRKKQG